MPHVSFGLRCFELLFQHLEAALFFVLTGLASAVHITTCGLLRALFWGTETLSLKTTIFVQILTFEVHRTFTPSCVM